MIRLVFLGSPPFATAALRALLGSRFRPALVVTPPDLPRGRGRRLLPSEIAQVAQASGVPLLRAEGAPDCGELQRSAGGRPDLLVVVSYGAILPKALLDLPALGAFNVHASLLPRHRGASPVAAAILAGDERTGVTVQRMVERLDAGPTVAREETPIGERETAGELSARLAEIGARLLVRSLEEVVAGRAALEAQDEAKATLVKRLRKEDGRIDWSRSAVEVDRRVRAMTPWPGAFTEAGGRALFLLEGVPQEGAAPGPPGTVESAGEEGIAVATGAGRYRVLRVKPAGGMAMTAAEFVRGRGLRGGERLGAR